MDNVSGGFKIIVDAMGGDYAPLEIIKGAIPACKTNDLDLYLVGDEYIIKSTADKASIDLNNVKIINANDPVEMDDSPSDVLKHKKNSSIYLATQLASQYQIQRFSFCRKHRCSNGLFTFQYQKNRGGHETCNCCCNSFGR